MFKLEIDLKILFKNIYTKAKHHLKSIFRSNLTPNQIAVNFIVGILIGLLIPMGLQTIAVVLFCALFKLNFVIVVFATLISNPFTIVFIYYSAFMIGEEIIHSGISWLTINQVINNPEFDSIMNLSLNGIKVLYTGLFIESVIVCILCYIIVYYIALFLKLKN